MIYNMTLAYDLHMIRAKYVKSEPIVNIQYYAQYVITQ